MAARRLVLLMLVLLFMSSLAAALVPVETDRDDDTRTTRTTREPPEPRGRLLGRTIEAGAERPARIEIELGDQLSLTVRGERPGEVEIPRLGELESVDPDAPARFDLLPPEPGSYAVRLVEPGSVIARIEVGEPARDGVSESGRRAGRSAGTSRSR